MEESRLVGDVWMPTKLTDKTIASSMPDMIFVCETKMSRIESGTVKPGDLFVRFTQGMQIADTIEGLTYVADAQGNAVRHRSSSLTGNPGRPKGWSKRTAETAAGKGNALSMASIIPAADRKRLDAETKALDEKNDQQTKAFEASLRVMRSSAAPGRAG